jgi:hypothetical protein
MPNYVIAVTDTAKVGKGVLNDPKHISMDQLREHLLKLGVNTMLVSQEKFESFNPQTDSRFIDVVGEYDFEEGEIHHEEKS